MTDSPETGMPAEMRQDDAPVSGDEKIFVASQWQLIWWKFRQAPARGDLIVCPGG